MSERLLKYFSRQEKQTTIVLIVALRVNLPLRSKMDFLESCRREWYHGLPVSCGLFVSLKSVCSPSMKSLSSICSTNWVGSLSSNCFCHQSVEVQKNTVNSEIFARVYLRETSCMRSFAKIKPSRNSENSLSFADVGKSCQSREFLVWQICLLTLFAKNSEFTVYTLLSLNSIR